MVFLAARPDFGFGNPNTAAAFFAMLAVGVWGFCGGSKGRGVGKDSLHPSGFWARLFLCALFAGLLISTASRGGMVALVAGLCGCWIAAGTPKLSKRGFPGVLAAMTIVLGVLIAGRMGSRVANSSLDDGSITSRLAIYGKVPAMMVAAPGGWGWGHAAQAYENWFQEKDDTRIYKHLVSTHATWLVEAEWGVRLSYIVGWLVILAVCWESPAAFGVWVVFGTAGIFSHVAADWRLGAVPSLAVVLAIWKRIRLRRWPRRRSWLLCGLAGAVVTGGMALAGYWQAPGVRLHDGCLRVGEAPLSLWFFAPDPAVMGRSYGKLVRGQAPAGVVWQWDQLARFAPRRLVLSGNVRDIRPPDGQYDLVWLNPPGRLSEAQKGVVEGAARKIVLWGELRTDANSRELKPWINDLPDSEWREIPGAGLLLWKLPDLSL